MLDKKSIIKELVYYSDDFEFYAEKIEQFQNLKDHGNDIELEIWRCNLLIELMENLKIAGNQDLVKNTIVLILTLYYEDSIKNYNSVGKNALELTRAEKIAYLAIIKNEFLMPY